MKMDELMEKCKEQTSCSKCECKGECEKWKRLLSTIEEPWEMERLKGEF